MNKNVPNILTMSRIACTPLVVLFFLLPIPYGIGKYIAFFIYVAACVTDLFDGKIARKYNLVSDFGKFMDQIADKFITTTSMILVLMLGTVDGWIPMWASAIMLLVVVLRDILIGGVRMVAANKNIVISADVYGKIKSLFLDSANGVLLFYIALAVCVDNWFTNELKYLGLSLMIVGVALAIISCVNYIKGAIDGLKSVKESEANSETEETTENLENEEIAENEETAETVEENETEETNEEVAEESTETPAEKTAETDESSVEEENQEEQNEEMVEDVENLENEETAETVEENDVEETNEEVAEESTETPVDETTETIENSSDAEAEQQENQSEEVADETTENLENKETSESEEVAENVEEDKKDETTEDVDETTETPEDETTEQTEENVEKSEDLEETKKNESLTDNEDAK